jgi:hypothetical protein
VALFTELTASRVGGVKGFNATTESRIVRVVLEESDLETGQGSLGSFAIKPDPRDIVEAEWARLGSGHPWDRAGLKAGSYRILDFLPPQAWDIEVIYYRNNVTLGIPPTNTWRISYRGATITEQALTELEPEPGGSTTDVWQRPSRQIGSPAFKKVDGDQGPTHHAKGVDKETGNEVTVWLKKINGLNEEPRGAIIEDPSWLVTYERTIPNLNHGRLAQSIAPFMKAVNSHAFRGAQPLHVKCMDISMVPVPLEASGQATSGVGYAIAIPFLWSFTAFGPHRVVPSWYDSEGHRATVFTGNTATFTQVDVEEFRNVRRRNFNVLLTIAARGF